MVYQQVIGSSGPEFDLLKQNLRFKVLCMEKHDWKEKLH